MAIGKKNLPLPIVPPFSTQEGLDQLFSSLQTMKRMIEIEPGRCRLQTAAAVTKGRLVSLANSQIQHADKDVPRVAVGIALQSAASGEQCDFLFMQGLVTGLVPVAANTVYFLGANGTLLNAAPGTGIVQRIGIGLSANELMLSIGLP